MTFQSTEKPTSVGNGNIQETLQITQIYTCPQTQGIYLHLEEPFFQPRVPRSQSGHLFSS